MRKDGLQEPLSNLNVKNLYYFYPGFVCSAAFLRLVQEKKSVELCQAAPVHHHPKGEQRPIYFSDIIVHADTSKK